MHRDIKPELLLGSSGSGQDTAALDQEGRRDRRGTFCMDMKKENKRRARSTQYRECIEI